MREMSLPSLFDTPTAVLNPAVAAPPTREQRRHEQLARDFIRWCFSFGSDFRNSPDVINLRVWCQKTKLRLHDTDESELVAEARRLYIKRIEHMTKKSDAPGSLV